jgi:carboxymethylenebutenolidase
MCFDLDSRPPIAPIAGAAVDGQRVVLRSADGTSFRGYAAAASTPSGAAMLVLPDVRGLYHFYEELALRFAEAGIDALSIDYFGRTTGIDARPPDFDHAPHVAQVRFEQLIADIAAGAAWLREQRAPRALFTVGFCFGGRLSFVGAARPELDLAGAIGFYGWPVSQSRGGVPAPAELAGQMRAPVLALFGGADEGIPPAAVAEFETALARAGVEHDVVTYPDAPHSFFDRKAEQFADTSADAWRRVTEFVSRLTPRAD